MMTRVTPDIETADPRPHVQRDPAASKAKDRQRLARTIRARYGAHPPEGVTRSTHVRSDGVKQVTRRLAVKRIRATGRAIGRWWKTYLREFQDWYFDRQDSDDGSNGR